MTSLFAIWSLSLMVVIAIIGAAHLRMRRNELTVGGVPLPSKFSEFIGDQFHDMLSHVLHAIHHMKPHVAQVAVTALSFTQRGHDIFVERVFGRIELKRGNAASFFLKHIAEHKKQTEKGGDGL
jgi:hypothetical protein